jgi:hypothetical protein
VAKKTNKRKQNKQKLTSNMILIFLFLQYIKNHFQNLNWNLEEDTFTDNTPYGRKQFNNIIVTYEPEVKNKLVLSCHYESKNMTDSRGNGFIAATDSAIPCTILLDIAAKLDCALRRKRENRKLVSLLYLLYIQKRII